MSEEVRTSTIPQWWLGVLAVAVILFIAGLVALTNDDDNDDGGTTTTTAPSSITIPQGCDPTSESDGSMVFTCEDGSTIHVP